MVIGLGVFVTCHVRRRASITSDCVYTIYLHTRMLYILYIYKYIISLCVHIHRLKRDAFMVENLKDILRAFTFIYETSLKFENYAKPYVRCHVRACVRACRVCKTSARRPFVYRFRQIEIFEKC